MIIDSHIHVWPDRIAARALGSPSDGLRRFGDGTVSSALEAMDWAGIDRSVCLAVADTPDRLEPANRFVGGLDRDRFIGFGSVHPGLSPEENRASLLRHDLRGVKVHPLFQGFSLDDPGLLEVLDALREDFVAVFHVGLEQKGHPESRATPAMVRRIHDELPGLKIVAAHFGGYHVYEEAVEHLIGTAVHLDTSWPPTLAGVGRERMREIVARHGAERIVFATDWPMADPAAEIQAIRDLGLDPADTDLILGENFARLIEETAR